LFALHLCFTFPHFPLGPPGIFRIICRLLYSTLLYSTLPFSLFCF
jgi:hypothetical protein